MTLASRFAWSLPAVLAVALAGCSGEPTDSSRNAPRPDDPQFCAAVGQIYDADVEFRSAQADLRVVLDLDLAGEDVDALGEIHAFADVMERTALETAEGYDAAAALEIGVDRTPAAIAAAGVYRDVIPGFAAQVREAVSVADFERILEATHAAVLDGLTVDQRAQLFLVDKASWRRCGHSLSAE